MAHSHDRRVPDCWHPHLHAHGFRPLGEHAHHDQDPAKLFCPVCHPVIGTPEFEHYSTAVSAHASALTERRKARGAA